MKHYVVEHLRPVDERAAIGALSRAFYDDAGFSWAVPDPLRRARTTIHLLGATLKDGTPFGETFVARDPDPPTEGRVLETAGAAVWLPPGAYPRGNRRDLTMLLRMLRGLPSAGARVVDLFKLMKRTDAVHPHEPHWYLALLGIDPSFQRTGAGRALLEPVLGRSDEQHLPAYLETQKAENVPWYRRYGFDVVDTIEVGGVPPVWTMLRPPR